jgi:hypothetical protein
MSGSLVADGREALRLYYEAWLSTPTPPDEPARQLRRLSSARRFRSSCYDGSRRVSALPSPRSKSRALRSAAARAARRQNLDLAARDQHRRRIRSLIRQLRPLIGTADEGRFGQKGTSTAKGIPSMAIQGRRMA